MGLFDLFFTSTSGKYPQDEHPLAEKEIRALVSKIHVRSLEQSEENLVEEAIVSRRRGDGKISLRQIYEVLTQLKNQNKISVYDRDGLMKVFVEHFNNF